MGLRRITIVGARRGRLAALLLVAAGATLSVTVFALIRGMENRRLQEDFVGRCAVRAAAFQQVLETRLAALRSLASFHAASDDVRREEFSIFAGSTLGNASGIQALEWVPRVADAEREAYEAAARADGYPGFGFTERTGRGELIVAARRAEYLPVFFLEPFQGNEIALGFDLASDGARAEAMATARDSGRMVATERVRLVQAAVDEFGFLVFLPVYRSGRSHQTVADRRENLHGYYLAVFRIAEIPKALPGGIDSANMDFVLLDASAPADRSCLFQSDGWAAAGPAGAVHEATLDVAGRKWALRHRPTAAYLAGKRTGLAPTVLVAGLVFTTLLGAFMIGYGRYTERIERSEGRLREAVSGMRSAQKEVELLDGVMQKINTGVGLVEILDDVFESFAPMIPYDRIGCAMIEDNGRLVRSRWARSKSGRLAIATGYVAPLAGSSLQAVVASGTPRIIPDLEAYLRDHPDSGSTRLLVEDGMRSNLTCPLVALGRAVGFLFFTSTQPDAYQQEHVQIFMRIANQLSLTVHKGHLYDEVGEELHRSQERFALAVRGTDAGIWDWDVRTGSVYFSPRWKSMLGFAEHEIENRFDEWEVRLHPGDRDRALATIHDYLRGRSTTYELEHRLRHKDGSYRWIIARGAAVYDEQGKPYRMVGSHIDVTDRKLAEESVRRTHAQLLAAQKIQERLLPQAAPVFPGLDIAGACYPSQFTAGDYFDYLVMGDGSLVLVIADVAGHGFGPALLAATVQACLRSAEGTALGIDCMADRLNRMLCRSAEGGRFVTVVLGRLDPRALSFQYINAGHPSGYVIDASGSVKAVLESAFPPMGLDAEARFPASAPVSLAPGDLLVLMTDGIAETLSPEDHQFGVARALELVSARRALPAGELIAALRGATTDFARGAEQLDDLTAVVLKIEGAPRLTLSLPRDLASPARALAVADDAPAS